MVGKVLTKLVTISGKVQDALDQKKDAEAVFIDLKLCINQAIGVLRILEGLGRDHDTLSNPVLKATIEGLQLHIEVATHHVEKWTGYGKTYWGRTKKFLGRGKKRMDSMSEVHNKIHQVRVERGGTRTAFESTSFLQGGQNECVV